MISLYLCAVYRNIVRIVTVIHTFDCLYCTSLHQNVLSHNRTDDEKAEEAEETSTL